MGGELAELIDRYGRFLLRENRSQATVRAYSWALAGFARFLEGNGQLDLAAVPRRVVEDWQDSERRHSARTRSLAAAAVRGFLRWAADHDLCDAKLANWISSVRTKRLLPKPIAPPDLARLRAFFGPRRREARLPDLRSRALFFYLLCTGARVSEALQVRRASYLRALVRQKGGSDKLLICPPAVAEMIEDYLRLRRDRSDFLFVGHPRAISDPGGVVPLSPAHVRAIWNTLSARLGVAHFTTHQLRHTFATELLEAGVPAIVVADRLGHRGLATIQVYGQIRAAQTQQAVDASDKLAQVDGEQPKLRLIPRSRIRNPRYGPRSQIRGLAQR